MIYYDTGYGDYIYVLVGGFKHLFFHVIYGMPSCPLTNSMIFQDGYFTTNQVNSWIIWLIVDLSDWW